MAVPRWSSAAFAASLGLLLLACGDSGPAGPDPTDAIDLVIVAPPTATVDIGGTVQFGTQVVNGRGEPVAATVSWSSSSGAATVTSTGLVTGIAEGEATITASAGGRDGTARVTVTDPSLPQPPSGVQAEPVSDTEIVVTWTDNSANEDGFVIEREGSPAGLAGPGSGATAAVFVEAGRVGANVTVFRDTGLSPSASYRYRVIACNRNGCGDGSEIGEEVATHQTLLIRTTDLPGGVVDVPYEQFLEAVGGVGSYEWDLSAGALPDGLTLSEEGRVSGIPTVPGLFAFTVGVNSGEQDATAELSIAVTGMVPTVVTTELPKGPVGVAYDAQLEATGGDGSYLWAVVAGDLPPGLGLSASGRITGTPRQAGNSQFVVQVTSSGATATGHLSITVTATLVIATEVLTRGFLGVPYHEQLTAAGGDGGYAWSLHSGALPAGLTLDGAGLIAGTPESVSTSTFTVEVQSVDGQRAEREYSIAVWNGIYSAEVLADEPVAYWRLEENSGSLAGDSSGHERDGTHTSPPQFGTVLQEPLGQGVTFASATNGVRIPHAPWMALREVTVEMWLRPSGNSNMVDVLMFDGGGAWQLRVRRGGVPGFTYTSGQGAYAPAAFAVGDLYHVVGTFTAGSPGYQRLFINGELAAEVPTNEPLSSPQYEFHIGRGLGCGFDSNFHCYNFPGSYDEVAIYDKVLSPERIRRHYDAGRGGG